MPPIRIGRDGKRRVQLSKTFKPWVPPEEDDDISAHDENKQSCDVTRNRDHVELFPTGKWMDVAEWKQQASQGRAAIKRGEKINEITANAVATWDEMERRDKESWDSYIDLIETTKKYHEEEERERAKSREEESEEGEQRDDTPESGAQTEGHDEGGTSREI
ncbi:hypothetical protein PM082_008652 [Marasmius tenuissimus]|nr:hypothetical protein PM082_008652 [Marasmius tenuissimus]